jgi:hypothetical protein
MRYNIFISYSNYDKGIAENLREQFSDIGVRAWVYSRDCILGENMWGEIKKIIEESEVIIFVLSDSTPNASGQQQELELVLNKIEPITSASRIIPLFLDETNPSNYPELLRYKNGDFLNGGNVKTVARKITKHAFPSLFKQKSEKPWNYPIPGNWLKISNLDGIVEQYFDIGDTLYFRTVSPIGLFECYSPKIKGLFWIAPENVQPFLEIEDTRELEKHVPYTYTVSGMIDIQMRGWNEWHARKK